MPPLLGAHVSAAGGVENAPGRAAEIGATALALFTRNQRQWTAPPLTAEQIAGFKDACAEHGFGPAAILPHGSYLVNLGSPGDAKLDKARGGFLDELTRCEQLGIAMHNVHPGAHKNEISLEACIDRIAASIDWAHARTDSVTVVLENTAGQGTTVGRDLAELAAIVERVADKDRVGVCIDTCHAFAAGYDLRDAAGWDALMAEVDATVGLAKLRALHLNDSRHPLGSRKDRHANIGEGEIGLEGFRAVMNDRRLDGLPMILETPDPDGWAAELELLRGLRG